MTPSEPKKPFYYLLKAADVSNYTFNPLPSIDGPTDTQVKQDNIKLLEVFSLALQGMEAAIRKHQGENTLTDSFREKDLRPVLNHITNAMLKFRRQHVQVKFGQQSLNEIIDLLNNAIAQLNTAATLDGYTLKLLTDGKIPSSTHLSQYFRCYVDCAELLSKVQELLGSTNAG